ncbi:MAG: hypothetical protein ACYC7E_11380 [Armatimonadota bacterium]
MKTYFKDWRNSALVGAGVIIVILFILLVSTGSREANKPLVRVQDKYIRQSDFLGKLKKRGGNKLLNEMLSDTLISTYAASKNVYVEPSEIEQVLKYETINYESVGVSLEEALKKQGMTLDEHKDSIRSMILPIKLVVPPADIETALKDPKVAASFTYPPRYRFRILFYQNKESAQKAIALLKKKDGLQEAANASLRPDSVDKILTYMPGASRIDDKDFVKAITPLAAGQCSAPQTLNTPQGPIIRVIQVVEKIPTEAPTYENRGVLIGQSLMKDPKYARKARDVEAEAMANVDVQFYPSADEFPQIRDEFLKSRDQNPDLGTPGATPAGPGSPMTPSMPAPPPGGASAPAPSGR